MKKIYFIVLFLNAFIATAQKQQIDSIYYLIDTAKTPINDRMWDIHEEYPSLKLYIIKYPCLLYGQKPTFVYDVTANKGITINKAGFDHIKFIDLPTLILKAKEFTNGGFERSVLFG